MRATIAVAQIVFGFLAYVLANVTDNKHDKFYASQHFVHGLLNVVRSIIEAIPFINITLVAYDHDNTWDHILSEDERLFRYLKNPYPNRAPTLPNDEVTCNVS
jgi:hypothetical protein